MKPPADEARPAATTAAPVASRAALWRFGSLVAGIGVATLTVLLLGPPDPQTLHQKVAGLGAIGPVAAITAVAVGIVIMVPRTVLAIATGLLFGWLPAIGYLLAGAMIGASVGFAFGRLLGREFVAAKLERWSTVGTDDSARLRVRAVHWVQRQLANLDSWMERGGVMSIWLVRMIPVAHYGVTSYAAGVAAVRYRHFFLGTLLGAVPGAVSFTALGGAVLDPAALPLAGALATAVGVLGVTVAWLVSRRTTRRKADTGAPGSDRAHHDGVDTGSPTRT